MNKLLPKTKLNSQGFTLVELLVVIVIISILAVTGFAVFSGITTRGNDARRLADIKAIADAYENKRTPDMADYGGLALASGDFAGGAIPVDPVTGRQYCIRTANATVNNAASPADITATGTCVGPQWALVGAAAIPAGRTNFKICVLPSSNLSIEIKCVGSKQ